MLKIGTAGKSAPARGIFRDFDGAAPSERLFRQEEPAAGATERYHVSAADDPEEISAERTADRVMGGGNLFREADGPGLEGGEAELPSAELEEPGSALPAGLQESMGESIGADFSGVRVHTGAGADRASRSLSARAFARGQDLYFREGEYNPDSQEGQHLIAHELAHVADGADGLHRDGEQQPASGGNTDPAAKVSELPPVPEGLPRKDGKVDTEKVEKDVKDFKENAAEADTVIDDARKASLETFKSKRGELAAASTKIVNAREYRKALNEYLASDRIDKLDGQDKGKLEQARTDLTNLDLEVKLITIENLLGAAQSEGMTDDEAPMSNAVKDMLNSPYFGQFLKAVNQLRAAGGLGEAEAAAAKDVKGKSSEMSAKDKRNFIAHQNELRHEKDTGITKAKDSSTWMETASTAASTVGKSTGELGESAGTVATEAAKQKGKADKEASGKGESASGAMSAAEEGLGAISTGLSMAQNSKDAEAQRKQDARAKQTMKGLAKQLRGTLPVQVQAPPAGGAAQNDQERVGRIQAVCSRIDKSSFNDKKEKVSLEKLIEEAMDESADVKPELQDKQKGLLTSLLALETSRASSKEKASSLRKNAIFGAMDAVGAALKSASSFITSLGGNALVGAIFSLISNIVGQVSAVRDKIVGEKKDGGGDENEKKLAASRSAIKQMAALPELKDDEKTKLTQKAGGEAQDVSGGTMAIAEQYAAAFYTIESANVNMSDILFAIEKGEFGKGAGTDNAKSTEDSLKDMYENLSFS